MASIAWNDVTVKASDLVEISSHIIIISSRSSSSCYNHHIYTHHISSRIMHTYDIIYDIILESHDDDYEHDDDHREEETLEALAYRHFAC